MAARVKLRVTKICCPACGGDGVTRLLGFTCSWCQGYGFMKVGKVVEFLDCRNANSLTTFGITGIERNRREDLERLFAVAEIAGLEWRP
ncbi:hypothetical protein GOZ83_20020 [Agrobacterium vitis]|uniref:hypothetical protein n=1 Tax=Agrobacterium vitis TaxID=373 RepID=UPI0012E76A73|nr:hypothetical protein [Agrobacterium vitis]MVA47345.1 hypothetical protein [Agrobacterium vitis]